MAGTLLSLQKQHPEWLGIDVGTDGESFRFGLLGTSLYDGTAGIALLFAALAQMQVLSGQGSQAELWYSRGMHSIEALLETVSQDKGAAVFRWVRDQPLGLTAPAGFCSRFSYWRA